MYKAQFCGFLLVNYFCGACRFVICAVIQYKMSTEGSLLLFYSSSSNLFLFFQAKFTEFKIQNMVGSCDVRFPIRLEGLVLAHGQFSR